MEQPLISVIIPVYKVEKYLDRCVQSVVAQIYTNLEIILVDDGSPDQCPCLCDAWKKKDHRIRVVHKENGGLSSARNVGLDVCTGEYISFVDSDDWIEPEYYKKIICLMQKYHAEIGCVGRYDVDAQTMIKKKGLCPRTQKKLDSEKMLKKMLTWDECDSSVCDKVFVSPLWNNVRFPLGIISEDVAVTYKVIDCAKTIIMLDEPMYNYFHRKGSITTSCFSSKNMHVTALADEIYEYIDCLHPNISPEANYFKLRTLLHWNRAYACERDPSQTEREVNRASRKWMLKHSVFVFLSKYVSFKERIWYLLILLGMNSLIRSLVA